MKLAIILSLLTLQIFPAEYKSSNIAGNYNHSAINTSDEESVLLYLKFIQDNFSPHKDLVPAMEDNSGQTFNNAVTAMAFILSGEKERAEKILNFFAGRFDSTNTDLRKQNFFYNGEARGFFQNVNFDTPSYQAAISDRWMGDNIWLLLAFKYYEKVYGFEDKPLYTEAAARLRNLLLSFYIDDPEGHGGFVRHGWRWGPRESSTPQNDYQLHEFDSQGKPVGHEEGNIDAYAAFMLTGDTLYAGKIKTWLDYRMSELEKMPGISLPLDLYSWRSLAFTHEGDYYKNLVMVPENDSRFKKTVTFYGKTATGFFSFADASINNVWLDGLGHMACAFYSSGYKNKGDFYSAQYDSFLVKRMIGGILSLAIPYTANKTGGYDWVEPNKGFSSSSAWYIFAKHGFNPFTFETNLVTGVMKEETGSLIDGINNYPNPFNISTTINFSTAGTRPVEVTVYDILGRKVKTIFSGTANPGEYKVKWDGTNEYNETVNSGVYLYSIRSDGSVFNGKMILNK
jgi:hypothetical protein